LVDGKINEDEKKKKFTVQDSQKFVIYADIALNGDENAGRSNYC